MQHDLPKNLTQEHRELVNDLLEWLVDPCLDFIRLECKMLIQTSPIHLVYSLQRLYSCLLDEIRTSGEEGQETMTAQQVCFSWTDCCLVWRKMGWLSFQVWTTNILWLSCFFILFFIFFKITLWLQGLFLFALVWTVGGTITGDSRKKFDVFFRTLISGTDPEHPKPKSCKITKVTESSLSLGFCGSLNILVKWQKKIENSK